MDVIEDDLASHGELVECAEEDNNFELIFTDNNGSFASRRALEQFKGKNRQYGNAVCPECKQSFVNAARLERHLAVHQVFGAYLCPLCGKTYKYEYNLFFHWRKTCQYLNELVKIDQRKEMDVNSLRLLVEEVVVKRNETEPVDIGISQKALFHGGPAVHLEMPIDPQSPLARACTICGILVHRNHLPQHEALHNSTTETGLRLLDLQSPTGGHFCDLCGVAFRICLNRLVGAGFSCEVSLLQVSSLFYLMIAEANIEPGAELFLSDLELKVMVLNLLWRLRRVSRQSPLRAISTKMEYVEEVKPYIRHGTALVFMDDYVNPGDTVVDVDGELVNVVSVDRGKWNIPENGKPLECPDCFRQFANAGRLERHMSGFHSHYGAYKCLLCGHRFKYDYNLLFHYRHSCAYTKLLVGADVRKLVLTHFLLGCSVFEKARFPHKQSDPQLLPGNSRLINIKRRPSLKAVPRNVRVVNANMKGKLKRRLNEGQKCPVCGVTFYGQKSLDKHIGTVHLLNHNFLEKAITRESTRETGKEYMTRFSNDSSNLSAEQEQDITGEEESPPVLEIESPGEIPPTPARCVDINGEEIHDFDAEQISELDMMLYTGQLSLGDLVITSNYGEDVEYRVAVGTRHGSQIVLEKSNFSTTIRKERVLNKVLVDDSQASVNAWHEKVASENSSRNAHKFHNDLRSNEVLQYVDEEDMTQYNQENTGMEYDSGQIVQYEVDESDGQDGKRVIQLVDESRSLLQYLNEEDLQCDGFIHYVDEENGNQVVELVENGTEMTQYLITEKDDVFSGAKSQVSSIAEDKIANSSLKTSDAISDQGDSCNLCFLYITF
ncbi:zinc finger, C2H2 type [Dictyocaulus viviparus]|uniref:Zinc finger, C2H2 type n=1 Tax=Dictyocaulus viviparus TaxID=29172 RepID=A0A0D8XYD0_DICVI|nr:zinc finger, C2H2 type [Dictyocaulus viviparus]